VSDKLPTREQALQLLIENGCSGKVVNHCLAVSKLSVETAETLKKNGYTVDIGLVEIGGLLHDIGRSKTHSVNHAIEGAKIAEAAGLPNPIISIIKRHVGGGITANEAKAFGWPTEDTYIPVTLEEKTVSYADKLIEKAKRVPVDLTVEQLVRAGKPEAAKRVQKLHDEISALIGDCP
jgi:uncharacterized protein